MIIRVSCLTDDQLPSGLRIFRGSSFSVFMTEPSIALTQTCVDAGVAFVRNDHVIENHAVFAKLPRLFPTFCIETAKQNFSGMLAGRDLNRLVHIDLRQANQCGLLASPASPFPLPACARSPREFADRSPCSSFISSIDLPSRIFVSSFSFSASFSCCCADPARMVRLRTASQTRPLQRTARGATATTATSNNFFQRVFNSGFFNNDMIRASRMSASAMPTVVVTERRRRGGAELASRDERASINFGIQNSLRHKLVAAEFAGLFDPAS